MKGAMNKPISGAQSAPISLFSDEDLARITEAVRESEKHTSGEIRVVIRQEYENGVSSIDEQALLDFERFGLTHTKDKTGVLLLLVLDARKFKIMGDSGISAKLPGTYWNTLANNLSIDFKNSEFVGGVCTLVHEVGLQLVARFPIMLDDTNELSDNVIVIGRE